VIYQLQMSRPTAYEAPRIRFVLVDGHSGERFPGWVVREYGYVFGLEDWYREYKVPAGGLVRVHPGDVPGEVVVETYDRRMRNDWIRTVTIAENGRIGFTMLKQPVGTAYDDLMVIGLIDTQALDEVWMQSQHHISGISQADSPKRCARADALCCGECYPTAAPINNLC